MIAEYPTEEVIRTVCKIGQGAACCRYLTIGGNGWSCEKLTAMGRAIDEPDSRARMTAQSDNCEGRMSR